jgi:hypothetical protein
MPRWRPFKLVDTIIMIAAAPVWLAAMRPRWNQFQMVWRGSSKVPSWQSYIGLLAEGFSVSLWVLTLAYLVMRSTPPRPFRSDLLRQPGTLFVGVMIALIKQDPGSGPSARGEETQPSSAAAADPTGFPARLNHEVVTPVSPRLAAASPDVSDRVSATL